MKNGRLARALNASKVYLLLLALLTLCYWQLIFFLYPVRWDIADQAYPWSVFISDSLRSFHLPLWNPHVFYGYPMHADPQGRVWYPITWILSLVSGYSFKAIQAELFIHYVMACFFMYACARRFGLSAGAAFLAAMSYSCSGFFLGNAEHLNWIAGMAWFPLTILLWRRALDSDGFGRYALTGTSLGISLLGGYPAFFFVSGAVVMALLAAEAFQGRDRGIAWLAKRAAVVFGFAFGAAAVQIIPTAQAAHYITRGKMSLNFTMEGSIAPYDLINLLIPGVSTSAAGLFSIDISMLNIYCGLTILIFLVYGLVRFRGDRRYNLFVWVLAVAVIASFGSHSFMRGLMYKFLPFFDMFRFPSLFRGYALFFGCLLGAMGFERFFTAPAESETARIKTYITRAMLFVLAMFTLSFVAMGYLYYSSVPPPDGAKNLLLPIALASPVQLLLLAGLWLVLSRLSPDEPGSTRKIMVAVLVIAVFDLFNAVSLEINKTVLDPGGSFKQYRALRRSPHRDPANRDYTLHVNDSNTSDGDNNAMLRGEFSTGGYNPFVLGDISGLLHFDKHAEAAANGVLYFTNNYDVIMRNMIDAKTVEGFPPNKILIEEKSALDVPVLTALPEGVHQRLSVEEFSPNRIAVDVETDINTFLVIQQAYYPGWLGFVDGTRAQINRTNGALRSIAVPKGRHKVELVYRPATVYAGMGISALAWIICGVIAFRGLRARSLSA